ncbi:cell division control protein 6 homolog [Pyxicephalus adspersus]|uniref:cell division control protein 6 homolog n=1 Tax=Pyxicephalus adspersus TaxID=30357 RepID=UPI003B5C1763
MPSTRSQSQSSIQFPKTKTAKTPAKEGLKARTKSENGTVPVLVSKDLPLSPRKRLGDDNLCNIPQSLRCSPPKQKCNENGPLSPAKGRRLIFDENQADATPLSPVKTGLDNTLSSPQRKGQETPSSNSQRGPQERKSVCTRLFKQEGTCYQKAKCALNTAVPERLLAREKETAAILSFLNLTDRILPRLQARPHCKPQLLNFSPYTKDQIATILQDRLTQVSGQVLDNVAIQFCARKVSAVSGDARKALDICRRAVEIVESDVRSQTVLKPPSECKYMFISARFPYKYWGPVSGQDVAHFLCGP